MTPETLPLPRWDLSPIFPSLDSETFQNAFEALLTQMDALAARAEAYGVRRRETSDVTPEFISQFEEMTSRFNELLRRLRVVRAYIHCHTTTDAQNDVAQAWASRLDMRMTLLSQLQTRYTAWVGTTDIEALLRESETARSHEYAVRLAKERSAHQMTEGEEDLSAELAVSGVSAWAKLHGTVSALLATTVMVEGEARALPISSVRSLAHHPDRETRRRAYEAELAAWESVSVTMAAALNGVKGFQSVQHRRRHYANDVEPTLTANGVDAETLAAMQAACVESFPDFHRYLAAKARALGVERLAWYDVTAPLGQATAAWSWEDAEGFIRRQFGRYSSWLADFADTAFRERWVDAEPRVGKEGGAYCTGLRPGESRVMMNFDGSFTSVSTLAHELGHAYHNLNLKDCLPLQNRTPSTLAETASIFCETLAFEAAYAEADPAGKLVLLDTTLERDTMVVVDIHSRFLFEKRVFERRAERDLSVAEFSELMTQAQRETYGSGVFPLHPYMWAVKGHYYGPTFYNYPYTFGLLFGLGLYRRYQAEPDAFRDRYDAFLSSTGLADAATLAAGFGINTREIGFWRSSLDAVRDRITEYEALIP